MGQCLHGSRQDAVAGAALVRKYPAGQDEENNEGVGGHHFLLFLHEAAAAQFLLIFGLSGKSQQLGFSVRCRLFGRP